MTYKPFRVDMPINAGDFKLHLMGDMGLAHSHIVDAKKFLAEIRRNQGINLSAENGQATFSRATRTLKDGTRIQITHEHHFDSVVIEGPVRDNFTPPEPDDQYQHEPLAEFTPWLWVGVRHVEGGYQDWLSYPEGAEWEEYYSGDGSDPMHTYNNPGRIARPHLCVWEPKAGSNGKEWNIISNRDYLYADFYHIEDDEGRADPEWYPLGTNRWVYGADSENDPDNKKITLRVIDGTSRDKEDSYRWYFGEPFYNEYDGEEPEKYKWDVVIHSPAHAIALPGRYFIKVAITGFDGFPISESKFVVKVIVGDPRGYQTAAEYEITQSLPNYTTMRRATIPYGFFHNWTTRGSPENSWYTAFWVYHPTIVDRGTNPHGDNWWKGGFVVYMPARDGLRDIKRYGVTGPLILEVSEESKYYPLIPPTGFALDGDEEPPGEGDYRIEYPEPIRPAADNQNHYWYFANVPGFPPLEYRIPESHLISVTDYMVTIVLQVVSQRIHMEGYWLNNAGCSAEDQAGDPPEFSFDPFNPGGVLAIHWSGLAGMADMVIPFTSNKSGRAFNVVVGGGQYSAMAGPDSGLSDSVLAITLSSQQCLGGKQGSIVPGGDPDEVMLIDPFYAIIRRTNTSSPPPDGVGSQRGTISGEYIGPRSAWQGPAGTFQYQVYGESSIPDKYFFGQTYE